MENTMDKVMEIVEETPEVIEAVKNYDFVKGGVVGLAAGAVANLGYKFVVKPAIGKIKDKRAAKKEQEFEMDSNAVDVDIPYEDDMTEE